MTRHVFLFSAACAALLFSANAYAEDYVITLSGDGFSPPSLTVPAHQKIKLTIKNAGSSAAEFESSDFGREKVVAANSQINVNIGPLDPGTYTYVNDFNRKATGTITAK